MKQIFKYPSIFQKNIIITTIILFVAIIALQISTYFTLGQIMDSRELVSDYIINFGLYLVLPIVFFTTAFLNIKSSKDSTLAKIFNSTIWALFGLLIWLAICTLAKWTPSLVNGATENMIGIEISVLIELISSVAIYSIFLHRYLKVDSKKEIERFSNTFKITFLICLLLVFSDMLKDIYYSSGNSLDALIITIAQCTIAIVAFIIPGFILLRRKMNNLSKLFTISIGIFYVAIFPSLMYAIKYTLLPDEPTDSVISAIHSAATLIVSLVWFYVTLVWAKD